MGGRGIVEDVRTWETGEGTDRTRNLIDDTYFYNSCSQYETANLFSVLLILKFKLFLFSLENQLNQGKRLKRLSRTSSMAYMMMFAIKTAMKMLKFLELSTNAKEKHQIQ